MAEDGKAIAGSSTLEIASFEGIDEAPGAVSQRGDGGLEPWPRFSRG